MPQQPRSDAVGSRGFGALWRGNWFASPWLAFPMAPSIAFQELEPIVIAGHLWGHRWTQHHVQFLYENTVVVSILNASTSRCLHIMHLLRSPVRAACFHSFVSSARPNHGCSNVAADALSRFNFLEFRRLVPDANPTHLPPALLLSLVPPT